MSVNWLIYRSRPNVAPWPATILDIARVSDIANTEAGLSGVLLFSNDLYLQYLEGPAEALAAVWSQVARDDRHHIEWMIGGRSREARMAGLPLGYFDAEREQSSVQADRLWRLRRDWQAKNAKALVEMLVRIAEEKYPSALKQG